MSYVLLADRHHGLTEGTRGLLEPAFETVVMVADETSLLEAAGRLHPEVAVVDLSLDAVVLKRAISTELLSGIDRLHAEPGASNDGKKE